MSTDDFTGFSGHWRDLPDYIVGITHEIWEERSVAALRHYYAPDIPVRTPMGLFIGNQSTIASTLSTIAEFPDRELFADDVIWCGNAEHGFLSSHRVVTTGTHSRDGAFGNATGKPFRILVIADCAARDNVIFDEWLVRDYGGLVRQLGYHPRKFARRLIKTEGGVAQCQQPFRPDMDIDGQYCSRGNDNHWGQRYADTLQSLMKQDFNCVAEHYDRAVQTGYAGGVFGISHASVSEFWLGLRASFPTAQFSIEHQIGMDADVLPPRAAIRWSLTGKHEGWGSFGKPSGAEVHVMGISHAEYGPYTRPDANHDTSIRREYALYDEVAIYKQILLHNV